MTSVQAKRFDELRPDEIAEVTGIGVGVKQRLWEQMARECEAMAQLALNTGRTIPVETVERLDQALSATGTLRAAATRGGGPGAAATTYLVSRREIAPPRLLRYPRSLRCPWHMPRSPKLSPPQHPKP